MNHIIDKIRFNNPEMTIERTTYYANQLRKLFQSANDKSTPLNYDWFKNDLAVLNALADSKDPKQYLPSLIKLFPRNKHFRNAMMLDGKPRKKSFEDIERLYTDLTDEIAPIMHFDGLIGQSDYIRLQDYTIASLLSGVYIPIYRVIDIASLKIRNINRITDNFYDGTVIAFQKPVYDEMAVPDGLKLILDKLMQHTPYDYLFMNGNERLPIQRFNYVMTRCFGIGAREAFKTRLDYFPVHVIPDFCDDAP